MAFQLARHPRDRGADGVGVVCVRFSGRCRPGAAVRLAVSDIVIFMGQCGGWPGL